METVQLMSGDSGVGSFQGQYYVDRDNSEAPVQVSLTLPDDYSEQESQYYSTTYQWRNNHQNTPRVRFDIRDLSTKQRTTFRNVELKASNMRGRQEPVQYGYCYRWCVNDNRVERRNTQLLDAIERKNIEEVKRLLQEGANPNATCRHSHVSATHAAAYFNNEALRYLLAYEATTRRVDRFGRTPLHIAAFAGNTASIALLLDFPSDLQSKLASQMTLEVEKEIKERGIKIESAVIDAAFQMSVIREVDKSWKDSVEHKCKTYMKDQLPIIFPGWTPLHMASFAGHHHATRLLLAAGADPNSTDAVGRNPLDIVGGKISHIDIQSYVKTIKTLIEFGAVLNSVNVSASEFDSALHIAVELCCVDAIELLLAGGASINRLNRRGNTPLHECVVKSYIEPLQVLAYHRGPFQRPSSVDVTDSDGNSVLHKAIIESWTPGVCLALDAGADVTAENQLGYTPIHLAALKGHLDILNKIINAANNNNVEIFDSGRVEAPLFCAIRSGNIYCVQTIIDAGAPLHLITPPIYDDFAMDIYSNTNSSIENFSKLNMIVHATAEVADVDILKFLLDHDKELENLLDYRCPFLMDMTPIEYAVFHNRYKTFSFLLKKSVERAEALGQTFNPSVLLDMVVIMNSEDMLNEIINLIPNAVCIAIETGHYPLHEAIKSSNKNIILQLIKNGADLSQSDEAGNTAISMFIEYRSLSTEFIASIFDCYIKTNGYPIHDQLCEISVDYCVLIPRENYSETVDDNDSENNQGQMNVLTALLKTGNIKGQRKLLAHPLVESFLYLKWKTLSTFFFIMTFIYCLFVVSLTVYTISVFFYKDKRQNTDGTIPFIWNPLVWQNLILITACLVIIQDLLCTHLAATSWMPNFASIEFWTKSCTYTLSLVMPLIATMESPDTHWRRHLATLTLVLAWVNIMVLLARTPTSGYYIQMFWTVSTKVTKILLTFSCLIIMFSFCFMIQFHTQVPFDGPLAALVKTLVMMTSEFDYGGTFSEENARNIPTSISILRVVFVIFLIFAAIVLMNLMIGVAVYDVRDLVMDGNLRRLEKQVKFLNSLEMSSRMRSYYQILGVHIWLRCKRVPQMVNIKPVKSVKCCFKGTIKDSIIKKAQEQFDKIKKEEKTAHNDTKLDKILHAVTEKKVTVKTESKWNQVLKSVMTKIRNKIKVESKSDIFTERVSLTQQNMSNIELKLDEMFENFATKEQIITEIKIKLYEMDKRLQKTINKNAVMRNNRNWASSIRHLRKRKRTQ